MPPLVPVTLPDDDPIVIFPLVVVHIPPVSPLVSVTVDPTHTVEGPPIIVGIGLTVTV